MLLHCARHKIFNDDLTNENMSYIIEYQTDMCADVTFYMPILKLTHAMP
jgi:hypothetical protein